MIIYMYKDRGVGYIYAFSNGENTYTCECKITGLELEDLYCHNNGQLPLEEFIRQHGTHIRRNPIPVMDSQKFTAREIVDKFQFLPKGNHIVEVKEYEQPVSEIQRHYKSWIQILFSRIRRVPARQTRI